jgi:hypothetical protein
MDHFSSFPAIPSLAVAAMLQIYRSDPSRAPEPSGQQAVSNLIQN